MASSLNRAGKMQWEGLRPRRASEQRVGDDGQERSGAEKHTEIFRPVKVLTVAVQTPTWRLCPVPLCAAGRSARMTGQAWGDNSQISL